MVHSKSTKFCPDRHGTLCLEQYVICLSDDLRKVGLLYVVMPTIKSTAKRLFPYSFDLLRKI